MRRVPATKSEVGSQRNIDGETWHRLPFVKHVPCDMHAARDFTWEASWYPAGTLATGYHATLYENLFDGCHKAARSSGILNELCLRTGCNGHKGDTGVFVHASPDGASFYVTSSRPQWPSQPMCFIEVELVSLKKVQGGMKGRYCATGSPGDVNRKVQLRALWIWSRDIATGHCEPVDMIVDC